MKCKYNHAVSCNGGMKLNYFEMYRDIWEFHKRFIGEIRDEDEFWRSVIDEAGAVAKKYGECEFIKNLVLNELDEFDRVYKEMRANANAGV